MPGKNEYLPIPSVVQKIIKHTPEECTFRFTYRGPVKPGQFFQISIPKVGECPISVSGIGADHVDLTLRCVGKVTDWLFENVTEGDSLFIRGPYGNGFDVELYGQNEVVIVAGGTAVSPIRGVVQYLCRTDHPQDCHLIAGFKNPDEIMFRDDFEEWKDLIDLTLTVDGAPEDYEGNVGMVTKYIPDLPIRDIENCRVIVVGPPPMIKFSMIELMKRGLKEENVWISDSRRMSCGIGKCGHCRINDKYVCIDGPVFRFSEHKSLID